MSDTRPIERIRVHYEVEKELASRLRHSTRAERPQLLGALYTELFARVPDHPRLTRTESPEASRRNVDNQMRLLRPFLESGDTFIEFAPGDCRLSFEAAKIAKRVIGIDISDQRAMSDRSPSNFELVVYDGETVPLPDGCADVIFSYQFLEHLHPDDVEPHFENVSRLLKPGGWYVFDTPHRLSGPHDVSRYFGKELNCFHFQEWTYGEMIKTLRRHQFGDTAIFRLGRPWKSGWVRSGVWLGEWLFDTVPSLQGGALAAKLFPAVTVASRRETLCG
ncbi:class I SAM-dependent methyltransferase [Phragmitibacter flavus]|nr:class I SAM-dependent methyltransferase [Phragmitibacter flavus]